MTDLHPDDPAGLDADQAEATVEGGPFDENAFVNVDGSEMTPEQQQEAFQNFMQQVLAQRDKNTAIQQSILDMYGTQMSNGDIALIRLNVLIDFILPPTSMERIAFEGLYEQEKYEHLLKFKEQVHDDATQPKLVLPTSRTNGGMPDLRKGR